MFDKVLLATDLSEEADGLLPCFYSLCPDDDTEVAVAHILKTKRTRNPAAAALKKFRAVCGPWLPSCAAPDTKTRVKFTAAAKFLSS